MTMDIDVDDDSVLSEVEYAYSPEEQSPAYEPTVYRPKILDWLEPTGYDEDGGEFKRHLAAHAPGTGEWITETDEWKAWHHGTEQGLLWIKGIPGAGKSVIAAHLVRKLGQDGTAVLYFFFRQIIDANHRPQSLLRDYLAQLLDFSPLLQTELSHYVGAGRDLADVAMEDLWRILRLGLSQQKRVYVVADALDEMDHGNDLFIEQLAQLGHWEPSRIKVILTSRPTTAVEGALRHISSLQIRLEERFVDSDIAAYLTHCMMSSSLSRSEKVMIHNSIPGHANGLFLYAKLAMDRLLEPGVDVQATLRTIPQNMNAMFTMLLSEHAERSGISLEFQKIVLQWVTHANRPLRLLELTDCIHNSHGKPHGHSLKEIKSMVRASCGPLIQVLPDETLSVIHHSLTEYLKGWTRHSEPLTRTQHGFPVLEPGSTHLALVESCLQYLSVGCLIDANTTYTLTHIYVSPHDCFEKTRFNIDNPFGEYAAANWYVHASKAVGGGVSGDEEQQMYASIEQFLATVRGDHVLQRVVLSVLRIPDALDLHFAAWIGLPGFAARILDRDSSSLNGQDYAGNTPLHLAAIAGHRAVVDLLLRRGAAPNLTSSGGERPIHHAAGRDYGEIVRLLLEAGVDPLTTVNIEDDQWTGDSSEVAQTALFYACRGHRIDAMNAMIPHLTAAGRTEALARAAWAGFTAAIRTLLELPDVQVDALYLGDAALLFACRRREHDSIKLLLEAGADPNLRGGRESELEAGEPLLQYKKFDEAKPQRRFTPMHAFAANPHGHYMRRRDSTDEAAAVASTMRALLQAGSQVNIQDAEGNTALHHACGTDGGNAWQSGEFSHIITQMLLEAGADANIANDRGRTPIYNCLAERRLKDLQLIVEKGGADVNRRDVRGSTPLMRTVTGEHPDKTSDEVIGVGYILKFLKYRPDCTLTDAKGNSVLHRLFESRLTVLMYGCHAEGSTPRQVLVAALLAAGANPNQRNHEGKTPLHRYSSREDFFGKHDNWREGGWPDSELKVISLMLNAGADLEAKDWDNRTMLFDMVTRDPMFIRHLVDLGCNTDARDSRGRSILHELIIQRPKVNDGIKEVFEFLISRGLNPDVRDYEGNTLFHELAATHAVGKCLDLLELLQNLTSPNLINHVGRTPLHVAAEPVIDRVRNSMKGINHAEHNNSFDLVLQLCDDLNSADKDLTTPLHLAAMENEYYALRLLDSGADLFAVTSKGFTALHLASRDRQSNIVGLICDRLEVVGRTAKTNFVNAQDHDGRTALHYASQSGRPESVEILLRSGANPNAQDAEGLTPLATCALFEQEQARWKGCGRDDKIARLEEIVKSLIAHGADTALPTGGSPDVFAYVCRRALDLEFDYTYVCFSNFRRQLKMKETDDRMREQSSFSSLSIQYRFTSAGNAYDDCKETDEGGVAGHKYDGFVAELLSKRQFDLVRRLMNTASDDRVNDCRKLFAYHGYADLLEESLQRCSLDSEGGSVETLDSASHARLLLRSCMRTLPNTSVMRCLLRQKGCQPDARPLSLRDEKDQPSREDAALHVLARGTHWWQVAEGICCLLDAGADIDAEGRYGQTPLHVALDQIPETSSPYRGRSIPVRTRCSNYAKQAAKILITRGADFRIDSPAGQSCLTMTSDHEIISLMLKENVDRPASALFRPLVDGNIQLLEALLLAGFNPNEKVRRTDRDMRWLFLGHRGYVDRGDLRYLDQSSGAEEVCPLLYAASRHAYSRVAFDDAPADCEESKLVQTLLQYGADPTRIVSRPAPRTDDWTLNLVGADGTNSIHQSIIHAVIYDGGCSETLLEWPSINLEMRDGRGMTLFLAACCGKIQQDRLFHSKSPTRHESDDNNPIPTSVAGQLILRGADVYARDASDNNALHLLAAFGCGNATQLQVMDSLLKRAPDLIHGVNSKGDTPYHTAVRSGDVEVINRMIDAEADVKALDCEGNNALHYLSQSKDAIDFLAPNKTSKLVRRILDLGVDINSRNAEGETILHHILKGQNLDPYLKEYHGIVHETPAWNRTVFAALISAGADIFARNSKGDTLLHLIAGGCNDRSDRSERHVSLFTYLMHLGLDPLAENDQQRTSLDIAVANDWRRILKLFDDDRRNLGH